MHIRNLETAIALSRLETFSATATHLNISQAAVSMRIAALEEEIGRELFIRSRTGVKPTATGALFIQGAERVVAAYQETLRACGVGVAKSEIRIGMLSSLADIIAGGLIRALTTKDPRIAINMETGFTPRLLDQLQGGTLDIVFGADQQQRPGLRSDFLCSVEMQWVQAPGYDNGCAAYPITPQEIARRPVLAYRAGSAIHAAIRDYLRTDDVSSPQFIHCDNVPMMLQFAKEGLGMAPMPHLLARQDIEARRLEVVPADPPPPSLAYRAYASNHSDPRFYRAMIGIARDAVRQALKA